MPTLSVDQLILPNLTIYSLGSVLAFSGGLYYALDTLQNSSEGDKTLGLPLSELIVELYSIIIKESICVWTIINMAFCLTILLGRSIQWMVFGELRVSEQQQLREKFWNFLFYKFIFLFGVINVQFINEVLMWCCWFAVLGFLHLNSYLSKKRFEYVIYSPRTTTFCHAKLLIFLMALLLFSSSALAFAVYIGITSVGANICVFMSFEVVLVIISTLHIITKYTIHLYTIANENSNLDSDEVEKQAWEKHGSAAYYIDYGFEMLSLLFEIVCQLHMLIGGNIFLSMASLVICMQLRYLFQEVQRKFNKHNNHVWIRNYLEKNYPAATLEDTDENSNKCAICWEKMKSARQLPCTHTFHNVCLVSWLEQDSSCPTCRLSLNIQKPCLEVPGETAPPISETTNRPSNHFFHFDGSRYVSWLPSFSVEVTPGGTRHNPDASNSQLDAMARRVQQLFPNIMLSQIMDDLRVTRSVELTIENILDGRFIFSNISRRNAGSGNSGSDSGAQSQNNWRDFGNDCYESDDGALSGSRFSKSSSEREKLLQSRREKMLKNARKRYMDKQMVVSSNADSN